jgi:hypothetical protein
MVLKSSSAASQALAVSPQSLPSLRLALGQAYCWNCFPKYVLAIAARGLRDLGPVELTSVKLVRGYEEVTPLGEMMAALTFSQPEYHARRYQGALPPTVGHVYEVAVGAKGSPYAIVKLLRLTGTVGDGSARAEFEYRFQSDGRRNFE